MKKRIVLALSLCVIAALLIAGTSLAVPAPKVPDPRPPAPKVDVCHIDGKGDYHLINISENALQAHLDHGDARPHENVPDMPGWIFDSECVPYELMTETLFVNAMTGAEVATSFNTKVGTQYKLVASGKYLFVAWATATYPELGYADAKFSMRKPPNNPYGDFIGWVDGADLTTTYGLQVVSFEGSYNPPLTPIGWLEDFNPDHIYTAYVTGDGNPISLFIYDNQYGDNVGGITVNVYELP